MSEAQMSTVYLTKSDFLRFRTCPAFSWTSKHRPELIPLESEDVQRRFEDGRDVEELARTRYPDGVLIPERNAVAATQATEQAIVDGASTLFQASVLTDDGLHARADVLQRNASGPGWTITEIKSSTSASADNKMDATFQRIAFAEAGYDIADVHILHLNRDYRLNGRVDRDSLFSHDTSVNAWADQHRAATEAEVLHAYDSISDAEACPPCRCDRLTRSRRCPTFSLFHPDFPSGDTVYDLKSIGSKRLTEVLGRQVLRLQDWPDDVKLSPAQQWQVDVARSGRERIDSERLTAFLAGMERPIYFLDYETVQTPVPRFQGSWPYQQVPFQYSLHVIDDDDRMQHREFLWTERGSGPIQSLAESLRQDIGDTGTVLVWYKSFEGSRNREMATAVPELEAFLLGLNSRMVDLMDSVSKGMWVHPDFGGSSSIKKVLPVAAPDLDYGALDIGNGLQATMRWKQSVLNGSADNEQDASAVFDALRAYCHLDTFAMVRIWQHLHRLAVSGQETEAHRSLITS
jgi:hypothetical protein